MAGAETDGNLLIFNDISLGLPFRVSMALVMIIYEAWVCSSCSGAYLAGALPRRAQKGEDLQRAFMEN